MPYTLAIPTQLTEEIKKSRFIVNAAPVTSAEQAAQFIDSINDPNATHNCWAWKIGQQYRFNDDGEPTSTAGRPILSAIEGQDCDQVVVVVTRYFGGIKLGTGGLIRAYGGSASHCLQQATLIELIARITLQFHCYYNEWPIIENRLKELDAIIENQEFDAEGVKVSVAITKDNSVILQKNISDITRGRVNITL
ncbi:YigZ family protein [Gilliamella sp. B14448G11]|uniref:IMPACT family protein n=1 Tax=unclassified Gilliamella TaxID=2685620 RepID=UPI0018DD3032|nr:MULTISPECIES: YigZ family protein [unclassified Gilliamella]MBI0029337.1 YigZ family protein [Gilliamella sp. B14448G7]MBI0032115.1 YigZ family protein [Gilliamella sp. B14384G15]MBI0036296.1 YigZ family protein [Gilliamella sp. B14448G11]MBI0043481.1 YigZ family protein [Gilliamella sp. B14448G12]MBI0058031.1 YigZ family protein [Gilliamella sp. B14384G12]